MWLCCLEKTYLKRVFNTMLTVIMTNKCFSGKKYKWLSRCWLIVFFFLTFRSHIGSFYLEKSGMIVLHIDFLIFWKFQGKPFITLLEQQDHIHIMALLSWSKILPHFFFLAEKALFLKLISELSVHQCSLIYHWVEHCELKI